MAVTAFHQLCHDPHAKPGSRLILGGEEGFKDAPHCRPAHAHAGIGEGYPHARRFAVSPVARGVEADHQAAALLHGIDCVRHQVGEDLVYLAGHTHDISFPYSTYLGRDAGGSQPGAEERQHYRHNL
jgi:hypothetical protein